MVLLKDAGLFILSGLLAHFVGTAVGFQLFSVFFPAEAIGSGFFGYGALGEEIIGVVVILLFILPLLFEMLGSKFRIWWIIVPLIPVFWFVVQIDLLHIWFYILIALLGWGIGFCLKKLVTRFKKKSY